MSTPKAVTAEQAARDLLERLGVKDAQSYTSGDLVELANLIPAAYLAKIGRVGGSATTPAKQAASRTNGRKGGRPKKRAQKRSA